MGGDEWEVGGGGESTEHSGSSSRARAFEEISDDGFDSSPISYQSPLQHVFLHTRVLLKKKKENPPQE